MDNLSALINVDHQLTTLLEAQLPENWKGNVVIEPAPLPSNNFLFVNPKTVIGYFFHAETGPDDYYLFIISLTSPNEFEGTLQFFKPLALSPQE